MSKTSLSQTELSGVQFMHYELGWVEPSKTKEKLSE